MNTLAGMDGQREGGDVPGADADPARGAGPTPNPEEPRG
jgi:hypothetical protein